MILCTLEAALLLRLCGKLWLIQCWLDVWHEECMSCQREQSTIRLLPGICQQRISAAVYFLQGVAGSDAV